MALVLSLIASNFSYKWKNIKIPANWWDNEWAQQQYGRKIHKSKFCVGKIAEYDACKKIWHVKFDGEDVLCEFNKSSVKRYLINLDNSNEKNVHVDNKHDDVDDNDCGAHMHGGVFLNGRRHVQFSPTQVGANAIEGTKGSWHAKVALSRPTCSLYVTFPIPHTLLETINILPTTCKQSTFSAISKL